MVWSTSSLFSTRMTAKVPKEQLKQVNVPNVHLVLGEQRFMAHLIKRYSS